MIFNSEMIFFFSQYVLQMNKAFLLKDSTEKYNFSIKVSLPFSQSASEY